MSCFCTVLSCLLFAADDSSPQDLKTHIITTWSQQFQQIHTVEYVLDGTELITPDFLVGTDTRPDSLAVRQRRMAVTCRIDFPNRRIYMKQDSYQWQVHLERFVRRQKQLLFDEESNRVDALTVFFDTQVHTRRSDSLSEAEDVGRSIDTLPLWFNSGVVVLGSGKGKSALAFPDYEGDMRGHWTVSTQRQPHDSSANVVVEVRSEDDPKQLVRLLLDARTGYLPRQWSCVVGGVIKIEINVAYAEYGDCYLASKWEATTFSTKGAVERCVSLSLTSHKVNSALPAEAFEVQASGE